jgi:hypothetical protein
MSSTTITASSSAAVLPTIAGYDISDTMRLAIGDTDPVNYEFSNSDLLVLFYQALAKYQEYRPYSLTQSITLVANQKDYALPSTVRRVLSHTYRSLPGIDSDTFLAYYNLNGAYPAFVPYFDWTDTVLARVRAEFYRRYDQLGAGQAEVIDYQTSYAATKYLRIFPTPTASGDTFEVTYNGDHPVQSNNYFTIPAFDRFAIVNLIKIEVLQARLTKFSSTAGDHTTGTTRLNFEASMNILRQQITELQQDVHNALSRSIGGIG